MEAYAPCDGVTPVTSCNGSVRMSPRCSSSQLELAAEPAVLGLGSAENDAELGDGMAGVTLCWKL
jgi:hypothetical protein